MGDAYLERVGPPLPRSCHPSDEFASSDGCIAPTPNSLRPRVGRGVTFTMGDVHPFAEAIRLRWAMHIHSPRRHVHNGRCTSVHRGNAFTMGDVHPFAEAIRSQWAMPPLIRTARLCRGPVIRRTNSLRPTDASPLRLIRCARALAEASRSRWAMHVHSPGHHVHNGRCLP